MKEQKQTLGGLEGTIACKHILKSPKDRYISQENDYSTVNVYFLPFPRQVKNIQPDQQRNPKTNVEPTKTEIWK